MFFLDTNIVIWLFQGELNKLPSSLQITLENNELVVSPIIKLELQYLYEIKRIKIPPKKILDYLYENIGLSLQNIPLHLLIEESLSQSWTRDPFDRLIVSHANLEKSYLVTRDKTILANYSMAVWD